MKIDDDETINIHDLDDCQTHTMKVKIDIKEGESVCIYSSFRLRTLVQSYLV